MTADLVDLIHATEASIMRTFGVPSHDIGRGFESSPVGRVSRHVLRLYRLGWFGDVGSLSAERAARAAVATVEDA